jgi:DNA polymerase-3 subunit gamma/tau
MEILADIGRLGRDPRAILESAMFRLSDLTRASYQVPSGSADAAREASLHETSTRLGREFILRMRGELADAHKVIRDISLPRLWLESELVRLSQPRQVASAPTTRPAAPGPVTPRPVTSRSVEAAPRERPKVEERPVETVVAPAPESASDTPVETKVEVAEPAVASGPDAVWKAIVEHLGAMSRTLGMKLANTRLTEPEDNRVAVEFERQFDLEWLQGKPKAMAAVTSGVRERLGADLEVHFRVGRRERVEEEPTTVELPAEGERLEQLAREVFGV